VANYLGQYARLLQCMGRLREAEENIREAIAIDIKSVGDSHSTFAIHASYLASILYDEGKLKEADLMCGKALEIGKTAFPGAHPRMAYLKRIQAEIDVGMNRLVEAESNSRKSL
jgi:tetratricopeptide (TPR) repeat protein